MCTIPCRSCLLACCAFPSQTCEFGIHHNHSFPYQTLFAAMDPLRPREWLQRGVELVAMKGTQKIFDHCGVYLTSSHR